MQNRFALVIKMLPTTCITDDIAAYLQLPKINNCKAMIVQTSLVPETGARSRHAQWLILIDSFLGV